jgi:hypothetical protein
MFETLPIMDVAGTVGLPLYHKSGPAGFPVETIPDGSIWYAHHFWHGVVFTVLVMWYRGVSTGDDTPRYARKPVFTVAGLAVAVYGWLFLWQNGASPFWGASFSLVGTTVAVASPVVAPYWRRYSLREYRATVAARWSDAETCVRVNGWGTITHVVAAVGRRVVYPEWVVKWVVNGVGRRLVSTRFAALVGLLVAYDDAVDHALPVTTPLDEWWSTNGHAVSHKADDVAVAFIEWVVGAINAFVDVFTGILVHAL